MQRRLSRCSNKQSTAAIVLVILLSLSACSDPPEPDLVVEAPPASIASLNSELGAAAKEIAADYVGQIANDFAQVATAIEQLQSAINTFTGEASSENMQLARQAWLAAHSAYEITTLHRYFASEMLGDAQSLTLLQLQYQINHWPIVPGYIDYVNGYPDSGIVHDINVVLNRESLREQHGTFDVSEVTLGFHVIEFLLWGNDIVSGFRSASDYEPIEVLSQEQAELGYALDQLGNNRRRLLLTIVTDTLLEDFNSVQALWLEQLPQIRQSIDTYSASEVIVILADSMVAMLTEELLLRSLYPMLNGDFIESMQSPYSQSTQIAVSTQLSGLESLLLELTTESGSTLDVVFAAASDDFSEFFYQNFDASKSCLVLLYSNVASETLRDSSQGEVEVVECINLLTNMVDHIERLKFEVAR